MITYPKFIGEKTGFLPAKFKAYRRMAHPSFLVCYYFTGIYSFLSKLKG